MAECFFGNLKKKCVKQRISANREIAILDVSQYTDQLYNSILRNSYLGDISPNEFDSPIGHHD